MEKGEYGLRAVIMSAWETTYLNYLIEKNVVEVELNLGKGWRGESVDFLQQLPDLKSLIIHDFTIQSVKPIHYLHKLSNLELHTYCKHSINFDAFPVLINCSFEWRKESESLFDCVDLQKLFVNKFDGKNSNMFSRLTDLKKLTILNARFSDLAGLITIRKLRELRLGNLPYLDSINGIEYLTELRFLAFENCKKITSISNITKLKNLEKLSLIDMREIDSLQEIENLKNLEEIYFYGNTNILDGAISVLKKLECLKKISFQNRKHYTNCREEFV